MAFDLAVAELPGHDGRLACERERFRVPGGEHQDLGVPGEDARPFLGWRFGGDQLRSARIGCDGPLDLALRPERTAEPLMEQARPARVAHRIDEPE
jgi:hypothetical protein